MINNFIFTILYLFHILIWVFVLVASFFKSTVKINIYLIIPIIYLIHLLPFHILEKIKLNLMNNNEINKKVKQDNIDYVLILPWNLLPEIADQLEFIKKLDAKLVLPIPELKII